MSQGSHQRDPPGGGGGAVAPGQDAMSLPGPLGEQAVEAPVQHHAPPSSQPPQQSGAPAEPGDRQEEASDLSESESDRMDTGDVSADEEDDESMIDCEEEVEILDQTAPHIAADMVAHMEAVLTTLGDMADLKASVLTFLRRVMLGGEKEAKRQKAQANLDKKWQALETGQAATEAKRRQVAKTRAKLKQDEAELAEANKQEVVLRREAVEALTELEKVKEMSNEDKLRQLLSEQKLAAKDMELQAARAAQQKAPAWGKMSYAQKASMRRAPGPAWPAPASGRQKKAPVAKFPLAGDREAANERTPPPKWVEESGEPAALLTFTGLAGCGASNSKLMQVVKESVHFTCMVERIQQNNNTAQLIVRSECWGLAVEALRKKGLMPLPDLLPWDPIPGEQTLATEARAQAREFWSQARWDTTGMKGRVSKWILRNIPDSESTTEVPRCMRIPASIREEGEIEEAEEEPGFSSPQLGRRQRAAAGAGQMEDLPNITLQNSFAALQDLEEDRMEEDELDHRPKCPRGGELTSEVLEGDEEHRRQKTAPERAETASGNAPCWNEMATENDNPAILGAAAQSASADHCPGQADVGLPPGGSF
ncbi:hypothetical protein H4R20_002649 [Coemansia guatemalensis]|uniref:Uncharacterized protein n=1 Tax=Coemansia guatemalensis TaxID=2761395 RepID=A0A9W8HWT9_9FUNG|nr:hypothetical protein H4R20_002649 [Coemansia guatemalensis]